MRTLLFLIFCIITNMALAQKQYEYRYWFDMDDSNVVTGKATNSMNHIEIDVSSLSTGLHSLNYQVTDSENGQSVVKTSFFRKMPPVQTKYRYWFDMADKVSVACTSTSEQIQTDIDVSNLPTGIHSFNYQLADSEYGESVVKSTLFYKLPTFSNMSYAIFIDGIRQSDWSVKTEDNSVFHLDINTDSLNLGIHTLDVQVIDDSGIPSSSAVSFFMKVPTTSDIETMDIYYSIDDNKIEKESCVFTNGIAHADLDVSSLSEGRHTITFFMVNKDGMATQAETSFFVKVPLEGTSIGNISVDGLSKHLQIYDLSGKQVHSKSGAGIYIVNKKKVAVK